jgi:hypothetical protein
MKVKCSSNSLFRTYNVENLIVKKLGLQVITFVTLVFGGFNLKQQF